MTKKKIIAVIVILSVLLLSAVAGLVAVLVLARQHASSAIDVKFKAEDVAVKLQANYIVGSESTAMQDANGNTSIVLDPDNKTGNLSPAGEINLRGTVTSKIIFEYIFTNNSNSVGFVIDLNSSPIADNMIEGYYYSDTAVQDFSTINPATEFFTQYVDAEESTYPSRYVYVIVNVDNKIYDASYKGTMEWDMGRAEVTRPVGYTKDIIVFNSDGVTPKAEYDSIEEAMNGDANGVLGYTHGDVIKLYNNVTTSMPLFAFKDVTVDGQGIFSVKPAENFQPMIVGTANYASHNGLNWAPGTTFKGLFACGPRELRHNTGDATSTALTEAQQAEVRDYIGMTLILKDVLVHANYQVHGVLGYGGALVIDGAFVNFGKGESGYYGGYYGHGIYMSNQTVFVMYSGNITGNTINDTGTYYIDNNGDVWFGAEVYAEIYGGDIGRCFINANGQSCSEHEQVLGLAGVVGDGEENGIFYKSQIRMYGGYFEVLCLEYATSPNHAYVEYAGGEFGKLISADENSLQVVDSPVIGTIYQGGPTATKGTFDINTLDKIFAKA